MYVRNDMGKTLYLECNAGISGDMTVAALLDLGADRQVLLKALHSLPLTGFMIEIGRVKKAGIDCCDFTVKLDGEHENHDHDMEYLHGHHHDHEQEEEHGHHHHHHAHRGLPEILDILKGCDMTEAARALAVKIFKILAEAEAKAHDVPVEQVHFHEVGAVDSIVDIAAVSVCLDNLGIDRVLVPQVREGRGTVRCQHGILPIPVPATANIMEAYHLPVSFMEMEGEFVTPTGAAILAAIMTGEKLPESFKIQKIGIGAGKREYELPSMLRAMLLEERENADFIYQLECNLDDCTGEALGYVMERLFEAGARDVHYIPVYMKKNRPGWQLNVICREEQIEELETIIFSETTTIGIRRQKMERTVLEREIKSVETVYGEAKVKLCSRGGKTWCYPEYESVAKISRREKKPYQEIYELVKRAAVVE